MIKEYGNVRKCTKKNTDRLSHIKVYRDEAKTSKRYTFFNAELTVTNQVVEPLKLVFKSHAWYLVTYSEQKK